MRTFMSALHLAHLGAWVSRRDLGFCSGVTYVRKPALDLSDVVRHSCSIVSALAARSPGLLGHA
jgi:hypothetical protein